ncbi:MAG: hypothetical protein ACYSU1_07465 [Planctomycetota bacterium]|jgi:hypothetical protein
MSTIGKFFVVLNLALSALFVGAAASLIGHSEEYRAKYEAELEAKAALESEKDATFGDLTAQLSQSQNERSRLQNDNSTLTADRTALTENLESERQQNADLLESLQVIDGKLGDLEGTNGQQANQLEGMHRQYETVRQERDDALDARDAALAAQNSAEDSSNMANGRAHDLEVKLGREIERAGAAEAKLATVVSLYKVDLESIGAQPQMDGSVLSVDTVDSTTYVVINLGKRDSVQPGYTYDVFNGSVYKGRIYVHSVNESKSAATVDLAGNAMISAGDRVTTRL